MPVTLGGGSDKSCTVQVLSDPFDSMWGMTTMMIDCSRCPRRGDCEGCLLQVLGVDSGARATHPRLADLTGEELRALGVLADAGLLPPRRLPASPAIDEVWDEEWFDDVFVRERETPDGDDLDEAL